MHGLMMDTPLLITGILRHALRTTPDQEIVCRLVEGGIHRYTYADFGLRVSQLAHALTDQGVKTGDRVGVMGWNTHRQLELYYALAGIGAICHTINPRLGPQNAAYVMGHAEDSWLFFDTTFTPLVEGLKPHLPKIQNYVALTPSGANVPLGEDTAQSYEDFIGGKPESFDWPEFDENMACGLCYTSGTTGQPKGVLYSHRAMVLHALVTSLPSGLGVDSQDVILPVVPMFHVNAWGVPYSGLLLGTKIVMPGPGMDGASLHDLIEQEHVTYAVGVPTVWLNLLKHVEDNDLSFTSLKYTLVGGSALSERIIEGYGKYGVKSRQGWGMTEMSPTGTVNFDHPDIYDLPDNERITLQLRQGTALPFIDMRLVNDEGKELPHDGESDGHLHVKGPWVLSDYFNYDGQTLTDDGWFDTGDVSLIHPDGRMQITDRAKDVIKSGGEWLSTIDIENIALSHPAVAQAAVIGMKHPKWQERPLLIVQLTEGDGTDPAEILSAVKEKLPKISWPDDIQVTEEIPLGATGKVLKTRLREMFRNYVLPTV